MPDAVRPGAHGAARGVLRRRDEGLRRGVPLFAWVLVLSLVPALGFVTLAIDGECPAPAAILAISLTLAVAALAVRRFDGDLRFLLETAHRAGRSTPDAPVASPRHRPALPATGQVGAEIERLAAKLSERARLLETFRDAEETIVELLPDPLLLLGADRAIRRANQAARDSFGSSVASVLRHPALRHAVEALLEPPTGRTARLPIRVDLAFHSPLSRDVLATVIGLDPPLPGGGRILVVLSDRTRERAIERTRSDFIANASHELRTPLASLIGFIDTLRGPAADDGPAQARFLGIMAEQAARMNRLIDDLLSLSRIEISEHLPPLTVIDAVAVAARVADGLGLRLAERGQTLALAVADARLPVLADEDQLIQVLENLLDNAMKYGRAGGTLTLAVRAERGGVPNRPGIALSVADDGPGIPREHLPRLTERFYRAASARPRSPAGTGLGLAIVKHIVNRHRGALRIESTEGSGSTFLVWLPAPGA